MRVAKSVTSGAYVTIRGGRGEKAVTVGIGTMTAGTPINVSAAVDSNNIIAEFNESNNTDNATVSAPERRRVIARMA